MSTVDQITQHVQPVILCGGSGTRLWPVSRKTLPKQFLPLLGEKTMLQDTAQLVHDPDFFQPPVIVTNDAFEFLAKRQLDGIDVHPETFILEPEPRNTAPAIALAAFNACQNGQNEILLVLPSDHAIGDVRAFKSMIKKGLRAANEGAMVAFGMHAQSPETGYGYVQRSQPLPYASDCFSVAQFVEKPDRETAEEYLKDGRYFWNSGMFLFSAEHYLHELRKFEPGVYEACLQAYRNGSKTNSAKRPDAEAFSKAKNISVDYAVMERTQSAVVVAADIEWSDVGSWSSLADLQSTDSDGNSTDERVVLEDCSGTFVSVSERLVSAIGLDDFLIIDTPDALLVAPKSRSQDIKSIIEALKAAGHPEAEIHRKVHRPWGTYEGLDLGPCHQVKHIVVHPGEKLSLQYHHHRAEHWVVVGGTAEVTLGDKVLRLESNQSVFIPCGATHRLYNPGTDPVHLIEVQVGDYLGEDDIVRLEDVYGRIDTETPVVAAE